MNRILSWAVLPAQFVGAEDPWSHGRVNGQTTRVSVPVGEGVALDGMVVTPLSAYPTDKWVVFFSGNGERYEDCIREYSLFATQFMVNMITVNYRGVGASTGRPTCADDLFMDGRAVVQYLLNTGVARNNITVEGLSLGGAIAIQTAEHFGLRCLVNNTFSSLHDVISHIGTFVQNDYLSFLLWPLEEPFSLKGRVLYGLINLVGTPLEMALRITYFALSFLYHVCSCNFDKAAYDVLEILKTVTLGLAIMATFFHAETGARLHQMMISKDGTVIKQILDSSSARAITNCILDWTGWHMNSRPAWERLEDNQKLAFSAPSDELIPFEAVLEAPNDRTSFSLSMLADHNTSAAVDVNSNHKARCRAFYHGNAFIPACV